MKQIVDMPLDQSDSTGASFGTNCADQDETVAALRAQSVPHERIQEHIIVEEIIRHATRARAESQ